MDRKKKKNNEGQEERKIAAMRSLQLNEKKKHEMDRYISLYTPNDDESLNFIFHRYSIRDRKTKDFCYSTEMR